MNTMTATRLGDDIEDQRSERDERRRTRVLLVEDDPGMRALVKEALVRSGYDVDEAKDGAALLRLVDAARRGRADFDVVVSDVRMPGGSGLAGLATLRGHDPHTPFILMTAFPDPEVREDAARLGATELLEKPFAVRTLVERVRALVPPLV